MKPQKQHIIRTRPLFLFLLPVFFVWHGFVEFYDLIPPYKAAVLAGGYLAGTIFVGLLCWLCFRNTAKASLFAFFIMCLYFFFGSFQDFLMKYFPGTFITRYSFLLSVILLVFVALFLYIRRLKGSFRKITFYLNLLLLILLGADAMILAGKITGNKKIVTAGNDPVLKPCPTCPKPDIFFILTDGYAGHIPLKRFFDFDNSGFEDQLRKRGFFIADSSFSNYNYTVFSVGSILNMDYLNTSAFFHGKRDLPIAFRSVRRSRLQQFLETENYAIYNFSIFDLQEHPAPVTKTLMDFEKSPLTTQTFLYRVNRDIGYHLITTLKIRRAPDRINTLLVDLHNNKKIDSLTRILAKTPSSKPRFVYTHLVMPHWPYYFDSTGTRVPDYKLTEASHSDKGAYVSYLKYVNRELVSLVDLILSSSSPAPVIVIMGDHGCRECLSSSDPAQSQFTNLNAVFLPDRNYAGFYKGMSGVNEFRVILNAEHGQRLGLLKDSTTLIKE